MSGICLVTKFTENESLIKIFFYHFIGEFKVKADYCWNHSYLDEIMYWLLFIDIMY